MRKLLESRMKLRGSNISCGFFKLKIFIFFIFRESVSWGGGVQREGEREIPSRLHAVSVEPDVGLHEIMTGPKSRIRCLTD